MLADPKYIRKSTTKKLPKSTKKNDKGVNIKMMF